MPNLILRNQHIPKWLFILLFIPVCMLVATLITFALQFFLDLTPDQVDWTIYVAFITCVCGLIYCTN